MACHCKDDTAQNIRHIVAQRQLCRCTAFCSNRSCVLWEKALERRLDFSEFYILHSARYIVHLTLHTPQSPSRTLNTTFPTEHPTVSTLHALHPTPFLAPQSTLVRQQGKNVQNCWYFLFQPRAHTHKCLRVYMTASLCVGTSVPLAFGFVGWILFLKRQIWYSVKLSFPMVRSNYQKAYKKPNHPCCFAIFASCFKGCFKQYYGFFPWLPVLPTDHGQKFAYEKKMTWMVFKFHIHTFIQQLRSIDMESGTLPPRKMGLLALVTAVRASKSQAN